MVKCLYAGNILEGELRFYDCINELIKLLMQNFIYKQNLSKIKTEF
ncbi:MAG: hypothetical protein K0R50_890 [Eubacterium sp.]|jgi:hypothetical protein|nr:hypothetical protein [Eubacterium sp.]